jgi:hypothetical protein
MSEYDVRNDILEALNSVYCRDYQGGDWYRAKAIADNGNYAISLNMQLTTDILALYAYAHIDPDHDHRAKYYGENLFNQIHQIIWAAWPGGSTAKVAATKVAKVLNIKEED